MPGMKKLAEDKFRAALQKELGNSRSGEGDSRRCAILNAVQSVYTLTPEGDRGLRDLVSRYIHNDWASFKKLEAFAKTVAACPEFMIDVYETNWRQ